MGSSNSRQSRSSEDGPVVGSRVPGWTENPLLAVAILLSILGVLVADLFTPLGIAVWVVYLVPVALSFGMWRPEAPILLAGISTVLMAIGFMTDAPGVDRTVAQVNRLFGVLTVWIMAGVGFLFIKNRVVIHRQQWLQRGRVGLADALAGDQSPEQLGSSLLEYLAGYLNAKAGAVFLQKGGRFERVATYGVPRPQADRSQRWPGRKRCDNGPDDCRRPSSRGIFVCRVGPGASESHEPFDLAHES
jgi:hypothetical protein